VVIAETTARELGRSLEEALQLVLLYAAYSPRSSNAPRFAEFARYLDKGQA
jgi:hypothetical protein